MSTTTAVRQAHVVRTKHGRVVVALCGEAAAEEAAWWAGRGYLVETVAGTQLGL